MKRNSKMSKRFKKNEESDSSDVSDTDSDSDSEKSSTTGEAKDNEDVENKEADSVDSDGLVEDELVKKIKGAKNVERNHPPSISVEEGINDICFNPASDIIAAALSSGDVNVYSYSNDENKLLHNLELHSKSCRDVEFSEDGNTMFSVSIDKSIMMTDMSTGKLKGFFDKAHKNPLYTVRVVGEHLFVTGDEKGTVKMWDARERNNKPVFSIEFSDQHINDMITNSTGKYLVCACGDGVLYTINMNARKLHTQSQGIKSEMVSLGLFRSETKILAAAGSGAMQIYNWGQFEAYSDEYPKLKIPCLDLLPITDNIFAMAGGDGVIRAAHMFPHRHLGIVGRHTYGVHKLDISNTGELIASYSDDDDIRFWNISFFEDLDIKVPAYKKNKKENLKKNLPSSNMLNASDFFSGLA